jgi:hypothetical protein
VTETHAPKFDELEIAELENVSGGFVSGGANKNAALGHGSKDSKDSQQVFIAGQ